MKTSTSFRSVYNVLLLSALTLAAGHLFAQGTAVISGSAIDASQASVVKTEVILTNLDQQFTEAFL